LKILPAPATRTAADERAQQLSRVAKVFGVLQPTGGGPPLPSGRASMDSLPAISLPSPAATGPSPSPSVVGLEPPHSLVCGAPAAAQAASIGSAGLDGAAFLRRAMENLRRERVAVGRPAELPRMSVAELKAEKSVIKRELRAYDAEFQAQHGREVRRRSPCVIRHG
jgi:hypothetical protein